MTEHLDYGNVEEGSQISVCRKRESTVDSILTS